MLEVLMLMSELTGDYRFEQAMEKTTEEERSPRTMCEVLKTMGTEDHGDGPDGFYGGYIKK